MRPNIEKGNNCWVHMNNNKLILISVAVIIRDTTRINLNSTSQYYIKFAAITESVIEHDPHQGKLQNAYSY